MSSGDRVSWLGEALAALRSSLRPDRAEAADSVAPVSTLAAELPSDGWEVVEPPGVASGYGMLRRGEAMVRFHHSLWMGRAGRLAVWRRAGVRVDVDGWVLGPDGRSLEPRALVVPEVELFVEPKFGFEQWQACFERHGLSVKSLADSQWTDEPMTALMYGQVLVVLAQSRQAAWVRSFDSLDADEVARWLGVPSPGPAMTFTSLLLECNRAAAKAGVAERLFRVVSYGDLVAVKLPVPTCAELVLAAALEVIAPRTEEDDEHQWRHFTLAALASMADETGHRELASVLYVEAMALAERAARSDVHGLWGEDLKAIAALQAAR